MNVFRPWLVALALFAASAPLPRAAEVQAPIYRNQTNTPLSAVAVFCVGLDGSYVGCGGSGGSSTVTGSMEQDVRSTAPLNAATANAAITTAINGQATVGYTFTGLTASGATLTYEQSIDGGTTWTGINAINRGTGVPEATRTTDGQIALSATGRTTIRVRVSTPGTGTITVATNVSVREGIFSLGSPVPPGTNAIGSVSTTGVTRTRAVCTLPAYAAGGNAVCTDQAGAQTTTTCSANTACQIAAASPARRTFVIMNRTPNATVDYGYSASVAPGNALAVDGPAATGGQGGTSEEAPAHVGAYFAASPAPATVVIVQGQ